MNKQIERVVIGGESFFKISNADKLRPFLMSIVSDSNHWMFIGSNGGLTAGRKNAEYALFPYYTDDKLLASTEDTGSKTIIRVSTDDGLRIWEPFSTRFFAMYETTRNLYKSIYGNKVMFEEINHTLELSFRYEWSSSNAFGFIRKSSLSNLGNSKVSLTLLDGLQNLLPYGVGSALQEVRSNLVDAYKRNELHDSGIGIYALSAIIVDKAEPSEALKANVAWSLGIQKPAFLLSSLQLETFRSGNQLQTEHDVKAEKGAYFISSELEIASNAQKEWVIGCNVNQSISDVVDLGKALQNPQQLLSDVEKDIELGTKNLIKLNASADALQLSKDNLRDSRHFSNVLFNIMRGGIFDQNYDLPKDDFITYIKEANAEVYKQFATELDQLKDSFTLDELRNLIDAIEDPDIKRLGSEYLPLKFSRRHGDPSRPWNKFSINTHNEIDGSKILDYEGNWRDIFQNWEALAYSYPEFIDGMFFRFLNASTFDGYNPYRITKHGIDWERIEPDDPWSYIGYWGDHQIIYLLKFLEFSRDHYPGKLESYFNKDLFVYANVPYRIKAYKEILSNPKDTIEFDHDADETIIARQEKLGADGALLLNLKNKIQRVNFVEKILAAVLAKVSNFIIEGGIWMNTQRPEWNDANNALVGNGVSMVTLYYLHRFLAFFEGLIKEESTEITISKELHDYFQNTVKILESHKELIDKKVSNVERKAFTDELGEAASNFRQLIYNQSFTGNKLKLDSTFIIEFIQTTLRYLQHSIKSNERDDGMYHAYNLVSISDNEMVIDHLSEMLEGQVAVLSSNYLSPEQALQVLDALKSSALFREDQYSYLLYPNKELPGFMQKNSIPKSGIDKSNLLQSLLDVNDHSIVEKDLEGKYHFHGNLRNANDLALALSNISNELSYNTEAERKYVLELYEKVFNHKAFTGRSGTFYGYEGLGSIYWHMVSKLALATQECCLKAIENNESPETIGRLLAHYYEINEGIGVHKSPELYGGFPTDPYSHTPATKGAQQPGMTGQVKEDILCRFGELGVVVENGRLGFQPVMLRKTEFLSKEQLFEYVDVQGNFKHIPVPKNGLAFTYAQIPVVYKIANENRVTITDRNETTTIIDSLWIDNETTKKILNRNNSIVQIMVELKEEILK